MVLKERVRQKMSILVFGTSKRGFSLVEVLIVLFLVGIMAAAIVPNFQGRKPRQEREQFIQRLNSLVRYGWQSAIMTHKLHRVYFDIKRSVIRVEVESEAKDSKGEASFAPMSNTYVNHNLVIPKQLTIKSFMIEGKEETNRSSKLDKVWFFIVPEGLTQEVTINMVDTQDQDAQNRPRRIGLVLNPFSAQFKVYDDFQK